jgi:protein TonB
VSKEPLGVSQPPPESKKEEAKLEPKPEPQPEPTPKQEAAVAQPAEPTPPPEKPLEKVLPPVEQPVAPLTMRDFVKVLPPPPTPPSPPAPHPAPHPPPPAQHAAPHPPEQTPQPSPLSAAQRRPQAQASANPNASVSTFVNPAQASAQLRAKDAYLWQVIRKFSQYLPDLREKNEGGTVVLRFVIARDGRLIEASIAKSSGIAALDRGLLDSLRAAAPYPPLPPEIPGGQVVFVQPIGAARR